MIFTIVEYFLKFWRKNPSSESSDIYFVGSRVGRGHDLLLARQPRNVSPRFRASR